MELPRVTLQAVGISCLLTTAPSLVTRPFLQKLRACGSHMRERERRVRFTAMYTLMLALEFRLAGGGRATSVNHINKRAKCCVVALKESSLLGWLRLGGSQKNRARYMEIVMNSTICTWVVHDEQK